MTSAPGLFTVSLRNRWLVWFSHAFTVDALAMQCLTDISVQVQKYGGPEQAFAIL